MTPVVLLLFRNATAKSSQCTSKSGLNHFHRFARSYLGTGFHPLPQEEISLKGLLLCFFTASLFAHASEFQHSTIRNYVGHVRASWLTAGAPLLPFDAKIVSRLVQGVGILRPRRPDSRMAFLLPHLTPPPIFISPLSTDQLLYRAAVIFGFFGMLRFGSLGKLTPQAVTLVSNTGAEYTNLEWSSTRVARFISGKEIIGFNFKFKAKLHANACAYYRSLKCLPKRWASLCPLTTLAALARAGLLNHKHIFPPKRVSATTLTRYMHIFSKDSPHYSPHSLRIGGHTFYSLQNMHDDFIHFLGRRKISRVSQLYYRANAVDNIKRLYVFFKSMDTEPPFMRGLYGAPQ